MKASGTLLILTPSLGLHGSSLLLLHFLQWAKAETDLQFLLLAADGGAVTKDFEALGFCHVLADTRLWRTLSRRLQLPAIERTVIRRRLAKLLAGHDIRAIYANTVCNGELLDALSFLNVPVVSHIRELSYWFTRSGTANVASVLRHSTQLIACSNAVRTHLVHEQNVPDSRITVIPEYVNVELVSASRGQDAVHKELGIPTQRKVVGMCGSIEWRKGVDLFVQLAQRVIALGAELPAFAWVGGPLDELQKFQLMHDIEQLGLQADVFFVGEKHNAPRYIDSFDVLALMSREEPFGTVCLEAAVLDIPTVCFANAGGAPEFVGEDAGIAVPYLDIDAMARAITGLLHDDTRRDAMGRVARDKATQGYRVEQAGRAIVNVLTKNMPITMRAGSR